MTKQNDMPEDLREANRLGNREHFADSADGLKACIAYGALLDDYMRRADKPADNGGDTLETVKAFAIAFMIDERGSFSNKTIERLIDFLVTETGLLSLKPAPQPPEVSGEVDVDALKRTPYENDEGYISPINRAHVNGWNDCLNEMKKRNLLKSDGVCVPRVLLQKAYLDLDRVDASCIRIDDNEYRMSYSAFERLRSGMEALRPFLPAEK